MIAAEEQVVVKLQGKHTHQLNYKEKILTNKRQDTNIQNTTHNRFQVVSKVLLYFIIMKM